MDPELTKAAQAELQPGERLQWAGRPEAFAFARSYLVRSAFGVPFLAFSLFWLNSAYQSRPRSGGVAGSGDVFWLFGVPFVLVGLWLVLAAPFALIRAPRIVYGVTDRRVFIRSRRRVQSWGPRDLNVLERRDRADGSGDLVFRKDARSDGDGGTATTRHGFYGIARVRDVEAMIARLRDAHAA